MNHEKLIEDIFEDFYSFFKERKDGVFDYAFVAGRGLGVSSKNGKVSLNIPVDIKYLDIEEEDAKLYILFLLSHELAHLVNKHMEHEDREKLDSQALEMWADFFGAKIAMSILTDGTHFKKHLSTPYKDRDGTLANIFKALSRAYPVFKSGDETGKYLLARERISTIIAGICAYLTRKNMVVAKSFSLEAHAEMGVGWGYTVNTELIKSELIKEMGEDMKKSETGGLEDVSRLVKHNVNIHKSIKGKDMGQLIKGLKLPYTFILDSSYESAEPNNKLIKKSKKMFKKLGLKVPKEWK